VSEQHSIEFVPSGRGKAQCPPDPAYPEGIEIDLAGHAAAWCWVHLPYPAPECGHFVVRCKLCRFSAAVTAAGRPDDPKTLRIPCDLSTARGYWMHEISGVLQPVVRAYLERRWLTPREVHIMRAYLKLWIDAPVWRGDRELAELRQQVNEIHSVADIDRWICLALREGHDPL